MANERSADQCGEYVEPDDCEDKADPWSRMATTWALSARRTASNMSSRRAMAATLRQMGVRAGELRRSHTRSGGRVIVMTCRSERRRRAGARRFQCGA